ncbi:iron(III) transport system permease protein [Aquisalibacillus elongatus]|uniref:Iron(III) transport system permease protein n=2 Tax=Aquisalibacillus elongatus TaxID=485577 RepID=A0A3N5CB07_9BACI|nr:iron(III) transport system permease protein [Aquisalibacillus elongatus]
MNKLSWFRNIKSNMNSWTILSIIFVSLILLPNLSIIVQFFSESNDNWTHIKEHMLSTYITNSIILILFVGVFTALIGTSLAWLISAYDFPLRGFFKWGLILPLAIPPYIGAYTYHGMLNYTGVIQTTLRNQFEITVNQQYFNIMNMPGAIFIFVMFLFPYVFTITKAFLARQSTSLIENARILGSSSWRIYFKVVLPITRASIVAGVSLVILEVLNDYGVVKYYGIQTFTTAIFQTWFGLGDLNSAIKLSGTLMVIILGLLILERVLRGRKRFSFTTTKVKLLKPVPLKGRNKWLAFSYCMGIFSLAFILPLLQLIYWALLTYEKFLSNELFSVIGNTVFVAFFAATIITVMAIVISNFSRLHRGLTAKLFPKITILGYSIPGAVIAVGIVTLFISIDELIYSWGWTSSYILSTSVVMLIFAYIVRYLAVAYNSVESGFERIGTNFTEASRMLGNSVTQSFFKIDLKLIRGAIFGGFILAFIDILKELPLTLILRPFNFETLATNAFNYATNEMIHEAAIPSILIIIISAVAIYFFHYVLERE